MEHQYGHNLTHCEYFWSSLNCVVNYLLTIPACDLSPWLFEGNPLDDQSNDAGEDPGKRFLK